MLSVLARSFCWLRLLTPMCQHEGAPTGEPGGASGLSSVGLTHAVVSGGTAVVWANAGLDETPCGACGVLFRIGDRIRAIVVFPPGELPPDTPDEVWAACAAGRAGLAATHEACALLITALLTD